MGYIEEGIQLIAENEPEEIAKVIKAGFTDPNSLFASVFRDFEPSLILANLYFDDQIKDIDRKKIDEALGLVLKESLVQKSFMLVQEIVYVLGRTNCSFPFQILVDFVDKNLFSGQLEGLVFDSLNLLNEHIEEAHLGNKYKEWFAKNGISLKLYMNLYTGLIGLYPENFPEFINRLLELFGVDLTEKEYFQIIVWSAVADACTVDQIQRGLGLVSSPKFVQVYEHLCQEHPDLFDSYELHPDE